MRLIKKITTAVSALAIVMAVKTAPLFAALQEVAKIEIKTTDSHGAWYTQPVWIAIGIIALVVAIKKFFGEGKTVTES